MNKEVLHYILLVAITYSIAIIIATTIRKILNVFIKRYAEKLKTDPTHFSFLKNSVGALIYTTATIFIFYKIPYLKSLGAGLFAGAGIIAVVIGFASQKAFANIISGVFILIFKPFKISDIIEFKDGIKGTVEEITLRHTIIKNYENRRIIIPNSIISEETIINSNINDEKIKKHIVFGISYESDIDKAIEIIREETQSHPLFTDTRSEEAIAEGVPAVLVRVVALSEYSVDIKAYVWTNNNDDAFNLYCDVLKSVKQRFDKEGIEIPYPHRTLIYKKDLLVEPQNLQ